MECSRFSIFFFNITHCNANPFTKYFQNLFITATIERASFQTKRRIWSIRTVWRTSNNPILGLFYMQFSQTTQHKRNAPRTFNEVQQIRGRILNQCLYIELDDKHHIWHTYTFLFQWLPMQLPWSGALYENPIKNTVLLNRVADLWRPSD